MLGIALSHQSIEIRKDRSRDQEGIVFAEEIGFVGIALAQQPDHEFGGLLSASVFEGLLPHGELLVRSHPGANESWRENRRTKRIHQAEPGRLDEGTSLVERADRASVEMPFGAAKLIEVEHKSGTQHSAVGIQPLDILCGACRSRQTPGLTEC